VLEVRPPASPDFSALAPTQWWNHLLPGLKRAVQYFLFAFGAYWIAAAWWSSWGDSFAGCIGLTVLGVALLYASVSVHRGELTSEQLLCEAEKNIREGAWWCLGGLVMTLVGRQIAMFSEGGKYIIFTGAILFGFLQLLQGYAQLRRAKGNFDLWAILWPDAKQSGRDG
jgi:hypothetical protein